MKKADDVQMRQICSHYDNHVTLDIPEISRSSFLVLGKPTTAESYPQHFSLNTTTATSLSQNRMLETVHLPHIPSSLPVYVALYHSVQNAPSLRQQLVVSNTDFEYAFIDATMVA